MTDDHLTEPSHWPTHRTEIRPWQQAVRSGPKADRMLRSVEVSIPPSIAEVPISMPADLLAEVEEATREIVTLDGHHAHDLEPLGRMLLRTESVASSKIEHIEARIDDFARALHGSRANDSARSMVAATDALESMIGAVGRYRTITLATVAEAHKALMIDDPTEHRYAGRLRDVQNWIGGSDHSPRGAMYVPPPADVVADRLDDLIRFVNRDDASSLAVAAIGHAQFESIHPFTDGNGRIGRALINAVLRRRMVTTNVVVPLASSLVAHRDRYFAALGAYRLGDPIPIIAGTARAASIAAAESRRTATRLTEVGDEMRQLTGGVRSGSAIDKLLDVLPANPIVSSAEVIELTGASSTSAYDAVARLATAGVLRPLTNRQRDQVWGAVLILDELEDLGRRIEAASR